MLCPLLIAMIMIGVKDSYGLENLFKPRDEYTCNNIKNGFGRVSTLAKNNSTYLESIQSYEFFDKSGLGEVMTYPNAWDYF